MAAILVESLQSLHAIYKQSGAEGHDEIDGRISDITQVCLHEISDKDKGTNAILVTTNTDSEVALWK